MKHIVFFLSILSMSALYGQSTQVNPRYQKALWMFNLSYKAALPVGSLASRYGFTNGGGADVYYKTKNNYLWGFNANLYFGSNVRGVDYINIFKDPRGYVFADDGTPENVTVSMRGSQFQAVFGKLLPVFVKKPQVAILLQAGAGFMQHKYLFNAPTSLQFSNEYLSGYDRLSNGFAISEEAGICNLGLNKLINFNIGLEVTEALTKNRRYYDYATMGTDTKTYLDIWVALKCSWVLPINARDKKEPVYFK
jgi:hypothetical protein